MSASFNSEKFDSHLLVSMLSEGGKLQLARFAAVDFKKGWLSIVDRLILFIKRYPIEVFEISSESGELDIRFNCYERTQEVRVWRAIDAARIESRHSCMECGQRGTRRIRGEKVIVLCRECSNQAERNGPSETILVVTIPHHPTFLHQVF